MVDVLEAPTHIGPYTIVRKLGRGSSGVVYHARDEDTGEDVALKRVQLESVRALPQLRREVHALSRMRHPGIVRIFKQGLHDQQPWYAMELLQGATLRQCIEVWWGLDGRNASTNAQGHAVAETLLSKTHAGELNFGRLVPSPSSSSPANPRVTQSLISGVMDIVADDEAIAEMAAAKPKAEKSEARVAESQDVAQARRVASLQVVLELSRTLAVLHGEGFVHRDLKPDNVFVRTNLEPVLVDFGLVTQLTAGHERLTSGSTTAGTPRYMSPEQIQGFAVDARADLYALGCIFYECLTGQVPFDSTNIFTLLQMHLHHQPTPPRELDPSIPEALDALVMRLLAKEPHARIGHAWDVVRVLSDIDAATLGAEPTQDDAVVPGRPYLYRPSFVGRDDTLEQMLKQLTRCARGRSAFWALHGDVGVGKTRLLIELAVAAPHHGVEVITAECYPESAPLQPFRTLFDHIADRCRAGGPDTTRTLLHEHLNVLAPFAPAFQTLPGAEQCARVPQLDVEASRLRVLSHLQQVIEKLTRNKPLLFVVDDAQWADDLTSAFLELLAREMGDAHLWCVTSYRSGAIDAEPSAAESLQQLKSEPAVHHLHLEPISDAAITSIIHDMLALDSGAEGAQSEDAFIRYTTERARGNPFFVAEYLRAALDGELLTRDREGRWSLLEDGSHAALPDTIEGLIEHRLADLHPDARTLLEEAAVLGRVIDSELLETVTGFADEDTRLEAMRELLHRQILEDFHELRFTSASLWSIAYEHIPTARRQALHRTAARSLQSTHPEDLASIAHHWSEAGDPARAFPALCAAAQAALDAGAFGDTAAWMEKASALVDAGLQVPPTEHAEALILHANALWLSANDNVTTTAKLHQALDLLGVTLPNNNAVWGWMMARELGRQLFRQATRHRMHRAAERDEHRDSHALVGRAIELLQAVQWATAQMLPAMATCAFAANFCEDSVHAPSPASAYALLGTSTGLMGLHRVAGRYFQLARELSPNDYTTASLYVTELIYHEAHGNWDEHARIAQEGLEASSRIEARVVWETIGMLASGHSFYTRSSEGVREILEAVHASARKRNADFVKAWTECLLARLELRMQNPAEVMRLAELAVPAMKANSKLTTSLPLSLSAAAALVQGDYARAERDATQSIECLTGEMLISYAYLACDTAPTVLIALLERATREGNTQDIRRLRESVRRALRVSTSMARRYPFARTHALRLRGTYQHIVGQPQRAIRTLKRALRTAIDSRMLYQEAMIREVLSRCHPTTHPEHAEHLSRARALLANNHWSIHFWWESA